MFSQLVVGFTGHRPSKIGGYDANSPQRKAVRMAIRKLVTQLAPSYIVTGGALGVDTDAANVAYNMGIPFSVIAPCVNHESKWPQESQRQYKSMCEKAHNYIASKQPYSPAAMNDRNKAIVDASDVMVAVWDGTEGGTAHCVKYARFKRKCIFYIHPVTLAVTEQDYGSL